MSISKKLVVASVPTALISVALYCSILFQEIYIFEFEYLPVLLFSAQSFLALTFIFIICAIISSKNVLKDTNIKRIAVTSTVIISVVCVLLIGYNDVVFYDGYTPEEIMENDKTYIQTLFPYHDVSDITEENTHISVTHITGTDYITLDSYKMSTSDSFLGYRFVNYKVEYFESNSLFMNFKFRIEKSLPIPFIMDDWDVYAIGEDIEIDGVKAKLFVESGDYAVLIKRSNKTIYASLSNAESLGITTEEFAREIINQFDLMKQAAKDFV